jgi:hypothetical protein
MTKLSASRSGVAGVKPESVKAAITCWKEKSSMQHEDEVREIAYKIWEEEGHPEGHDQEHWYKAEATWQERQDQMEHMSDDLVSRTDLVASKVVGERKQAPKQARRCEE